MSNDDRKVGIASSVDPTGARTGVEQIKQELRTIPGAAQQAAQQTSRNLDGIGNSAEKTASSASRAYGRFNAEIARVTAQTKAALEGTGKSGEIMNRAVSQGLDPTKLEPGLVKLRELEIQQKSLGKSSGELTQALRTVPAQFTDIVTSLSSGQKPLQVFLQQGGQLKDQFGGAGAAAAALGRYIVGLINPFTVAAVVALGFGKAVHDGAAESREFQKQMILSGDAAGYTAGQLALARDAAAQLSGATKGRTAEVIAGIASSAGIGADNLARFTAAAISFERAGGDAAEKTADAFKALAKAPLEASLKLNQSMNYLTTSTYSQIKALEDQGRIVEAARIAQEAYFDAISGRTPELEKNLGYLERGWRGVKDIAKGAWDAMLDVGRSSEQSLDQKLAKAQADLAAFSSSRGAFGYTQGERSKREAELQAEVETLRQQQQLEEKKAQEQAKQLRTSEAKAKWDQQTLQYLSNAEKLEMALAKAQELGVSAGQTQLEIEKQKAKLRQQYDPQTQLDRIATAENTRNEQIKRGIIEVNGLRERGVLNEYEAVDRLYALERQQQQSQKKALLERLAYAQGRVNSEKEVSQIQAELAANEQAQRTSAVKHENDIANLLYRRKVAAEQAAEAERQLNDAEASAAAAMRKQALDDYTIGLQNSARAIDEETGLLQLQASMMGATQAARERAIEFYRIELDLKKQLREIDALMTPNGEADREELRAKARAQATQRQVLATQRATVEEWQRNVDQISDSLTDALLRGFENGKDFGRNLVDTLKNMFATLVLKPIIQPIFAAGADFLGSFFGMGGSAASSLLGGASGGGGTLSSLASLGSMGMQLAGLKSIFGMGAQLTGWTGAGTGIALEGAGSMIANGSIMQGLAQGAGALAPWALGAGAGIYGGRAISGGYSVSGSGNGVVNVGTAIGAVIAGPIGAAVGGAIGGLVNRAFGSKMVYGDAGIEGSISGGDTSAQNYQDWVKKGGWFRSDKSGTNYTAISADLDATLDASSKAVLAQSEAWAKALGLPAEKLAQVTTAFKVKLTGNQEEDQQALTDLFAKYQTQLTEQFRDALLPFQKAGEDLTVTLQRLAGLQQFSDALNSLGGIFSKIATSSVDAKEGLIALVGGTEQLMQMATGFIGNYYSRDEIAGGKAASIRDTLSGVGLNVDFTSEDPRAQFRKLVEGIDISTPEGQKKLATLLGIQGDFADVANYLTETGKSLSQVATQAPESSLLAPLLASGTTQQVQATNEVRDAINKLTEVVQQQGGVGSSGSGRIGPIFSEVGLAP